MNAGIVEWTVALAVFGAALGEQSKTWFATLSRRRKCCRFCQLRFLPCRSFSELPEKKRRNLKRSFCNFLRNFALNVAPKFLRLSWQVVFPKLHQSSAIRDLACQIKLHPIISHHTSAGMATLTDIQFQECSNRPNGAYRVSKKWDCACTAELAYLFCRAHIPSKTDLSRKEASLSLRSHFWKPCATRLYELNSKEGYWGRSKRDHGKWRNSCVIVTQ